MAEKIVEFFRMMFHNDALSTMVISAIPIVELRGAIPLAIKMGSMTYLEVFIFAYIGSVLVSPILFFLLKPVLVLLKKIKWLNSIAINIENLIRDKAQKLKNKAQLTEGVDRNVDKVKFWGIMLFVAVPLPLTGTWTGTGIAVFLDMKFFPTLLAVMLGNLIAGAVILVLSIFLVMYIDLIIYVFTAIVILVIVYYIIKLATNQRKV